MPFLVQFIFICIITALSATTVAAPTINVQADKASYTVGEQVIISITLSDAPMIYGGGLDLTFNPAVVNANSVQVNPIWDFTIKEGIIDNATGVINDIFFTHFSGLTGDISVATIVLDTIASGSAGIAVTESLAKQFTDTGGENVVFTTNNLASSVLVNTAQAEADQTDTDQTATEQDATNQSETQQATTDNSVLIPVNKSSNPEEHSDTIENNEHGASDTFITNMQQGNADVGSYNNMKTPSTTRPGIDSEHSEEAYKDLTTQTSLPADNNSVISTDKKKADDSPVLWITFGFLILAFTGYKIFVYSRT